MRGGTVSAQHKKNELSQISDRDLDPLRKICLCTCIQEVDRREWQSVNISVTQQTEAVIYKTRSPSMPDLIYYIIIIIIIIIIIMCPTYLLRSTAATAVRLMHALLAKKPDLSANGT